MGTETWTAEKRSAAWAKRRPPSIEAYMVSGLVPQENGCWFWRGRNTRHASGMYDGEWFGIHIKSYELWVGPIPEGMMVRHTCDNPGCFNPDHLVPGTSKDNRRDFMERHPRAMEIVQNASRLRDEARDRFWSELTPEARDEFIARRVQAQKDKRHDRINHSA